MTAAARKLAQPAASTSALDVFIARAETRALLWQAGEFDLHQAVDELQAARDGLVAEIGLDEVQAILAKAFGEVRDQEASSGPLNTAADDEEDPLLEGLKICADTQRHLEEWERRKAKTASQVPSM